MHEATNSKLQRQITGDCAVTATGVYEMKAITGNLPTVIMLWFDLVDKSIT